MINGVDPLLPQINERKQSRGEKPAFSVRKALNDSPIKFKVSTSIPSAEILQELEKLDDKIRIKIATTLGVIHCYLVDRRPVENQPDFFHSVAADALREAYTKQLIHNKNHGKKAVITFNQIVNTLTLIQHILKDKSDKEVTAVLKTFESILKAHYNTFLLVLKNATPEVLAFIKNNEKALYKKIISKKKPLEPYLLDHSDKENILTSYPPESPEKPSRQAQGKPTPKKLSVQNKRSIEILRELRSPEPKPAMAQLVERLELVSTDLLQSPAIHPKTKKFCPLFGISIQEDEAAPSLPVQSQEEPISLSRKQKPTPKRNRSKSIC